MNPRLVPPRRRRLVPSGRRGCLSLSGPRIDDLRCDVAASACCAIPIVAGRDLVCERPTIEHLSAGGYRIRARARLDPFGPLIGQVVLRASVVDASGATLIGNGLPVDDTLAVLVAEGRDLRAEVTIAASSCLAGVLASRLGLRLSIAWVARPDDAAAATWFRDC